MKKLREHVPAANGHRPFKRLDLEESLERAAKPVNERNCSKHR